MVDLETTDGRKWAVNPLAVRYMWEEAHHVDIELVSGKLLSVKGSWEQVKQTIWPN